MFGIFASPERKMRENAGNWLELADKVYHYRRDVLSAAEVTELQGETTGLRGLLKEKAGVRKGSEISVSVSVERRIFAASAASRRRERRGRS